MIAAFSSWQVQRATTTTRNRIASSTTISIIQNNTQQQQQLQQKSYHRPPSSLFSSRLLLSSSSSDVEEEEEDSSSPSLSSSSSENSSSSFRNHLNDLSLPSSSSSTTSSSASASASASVSSSLLLKNRFFALRHGQSLANVAGLIASSPDIACHNYGLSEEGKKQAQLAGKSLVDAFVVEQQVEPELELEAAAARSSKDDDKGGNRNLAGIAIVSSDLLRAKETAQIVADAVESYNKNHNKETIEAGDNISGEAIPISITIDTRLRERGFGEWDGGSDVHYNDVWKDDATDPYHTLRKVESVWSVTDRATQCVVDWDDRLRFRPRFPQQKSLVVVEEEEDEGGKEEEESYWWVVCVAHGDVLQILQTAFKKMDPSKHRSMEHLETATLRSLELD